MAVGGALRAALRAGRFGTAARESRRQARAVRSINERGGFRMAPEPSSSLEMRGYDRFMGQGYGETARGNAVIFDPYTGARTVLPQTLDDALTGAPMPRGPVAAPYEGVRTWSGRADDGFPRSFDAPPPWMGRGTPPPSRSYTMYDSYAGNEFPSAVRRSPYDEAFTMFEPYSPFGMSAPPNQNFMNLRIPRAFGGQGQIGGQAQSAPLWARESMSPQELMEFMNPNAFAPRPRFFFDDFA